MFLVFLTNSERKVERKVSVSHLKIVQNENCFASPLPFCMPMFLSAPKPFLIMNIIHRKVLWFAHDTCRIAPIDYLSYSNTPTKSDATEMFLFCSRFKTIPFFLLSNLFIKSSISRFFIVLAMLSALWKNISLVFKSISWLMAMCTWCVYCLYQWPFLAPQWWHAPFAFLPTTNSPKAWHPKHEPPDLCNRFHRRVWWIFFGPGINPPNNLPFPVIYWDLKSGPLKVYFILEDFYFLCLLFLAREKGVWREVRQNLEGVHYPWGHTLPYTPSRQSLRWEAVLTEVTHRGLRQRFLDQVSRQHNTSSIGAVWCQGQRESILLCCRLTYTHEAWPTRILGFVKIRFKIENVTEHTSALGNSIHEREAPENPKSDDLRGGGCMVFEEGNASKKEVVLPVGI